MAIYAVFLTYSLSMMFFGDTGVGALQRVNERNQLLAENMANLEAKRSDLARTLESLRSDPGALEIEARAMGLYNPGEQVLLFRDLEHVQVLPDAGRVLLLDRPAEGNKVIFRVLSVAVGISVLLIGLIAWRLRDASSTK